MSGVHFRSFIPVGLAIVMCQGVVAAAPRLAQAQDPTARITQMNREALAAIDKREFEKAREILKKALDLCETSGMAQHPIAARTHIHMGVVIIEGFKNHELGEKQFIQALAIEPTIALTPSLVTPELSEAFDEAKGRGAGGSAPVTPIADEQPSSAPARAASGGGGGFAYHTVSEVKQGHAIRVTVNVDDGLKFHKIVLAYRPQGSSDFLGREMDPVGNGAYSAEIPDSATTGSTVAYYIEAENDDGQPVANRGTDERPLVIQLDGAPPRAERHLAAKHGDSDDSTTVRTSAEEGEEEASGTWFVSLLVGSGVGYASGNGELNANVPVSGAFASTSLGHIAPEVGYWIQPDLLLSAQGRLQVVTGPTEIDAGNGHVYSPPGWAIALFAKASYYFGAGSDSFRPFVSGGLGGGQIRHVVTLGAFKDCGASRNQTCVDSVVAGPALAEVGGGFLYKLSPLFGIVASTNLETAAPKFTFNIDLNAGVAFTF